MTVPLTRDHLIADYCRRRTKGGESDAEATAGIRSVCRFLDEAFIKSALDEARGLPLIPRRWPYRRKFVKGPALNTTSSLLFVLERGEWVYLRDTPKHPSVIKNMSLSTLEGMVRAGVLYYAIRQEEPCQTEKTSS